LPIEFDDQRVDVRGVDDRRAGSGSGGAGRAIGGGVGIVGAIVTVLFVLLGGGDPALLGVPPGLDAGSGNAESAQDLAERCNEAGALDRDIDCRLIKVYDVADDVWSEEFARRGLPYQAPRLAFFTAAAATGCGRASSAVGPFYCPADQEIYFDLNFLDRLQQQFGAPGEFAQAYIAAHEFGHHLQTLLGIEQRVREAQTSNPDAAGRYSVALELQADCFAGIWAKLADERAEGGIALTQDNIAEAVNAAEAVGDDRIQQQVQGRVDPETWTHGSAAQRHQWFVTGYRSGDLDACDTFTPR
jgi:predicted metalloprotease